MPQISRGFSVRSENQWHQRPAFTPPCGELVSERRGEGCFFEANFAQIREDDDCHRDRRVDFSGDDHDAAVHAQNGSVNGMANVLVRARADELVSRRNPDFAAPVAAERAARPDRQGKAGNLQREADAVYEMIRGQKSPGENRCSRREPADSDDSAGLLFLAAALQ